jgi:hypothetical protein
LPLSSLFVAVFYDVSDWFISIFLSVYLVFGEFIVIGSNYAVVMGFITF